MQPFELHRPDSLRAALAARRAAPGGKYLAGGQSLLPLLKLDLADPSDLVALSGLADLRGIREDGDALVVGAGTTHAELAADAAARAAIPALCALAGGIGDPQVRNRGTLGGSVAHADPAADHPAGVVALDATVVTDRREIAADAFFTGLYQTALEEDELVTAVRFPRPACAAYQKFPHPASRFALVGVFVARRAGAVRVAVTGASARVFRLPDFETALAARFEAGALDGLAVDPGPLLDNPDASAGYRAHLIGVLARRAVAACA